MEVYTICMDAYAHMNIYLSDSYKSCKIKNMSAALNKFLFCKVFSFFFLTHSSRKTEHRNLILHTVGKNEMEHLSLS